MSAAITDRFKVSSLRPASPQACVQRREEMRWRSERLAAPRGISDYRLRPVSGLVGSGVSPSRERSLTVAGLSACAKRRLRPLDLIRPRTLTVAGAAEALANENFFPRLGGFSRGHRPLDRLGAAPLSRFTPARGTHRNTSNERVDCTTQVPATPVSYSWNLH